MTAPVPDEGPPQRPQAPDPASHRRSAAAPLTHRASRAATLRPLLTGVHIVRRVVARLIASG